MVSDDSLDDHFVLGRPRPERFFKYTSASTAKIVLKNGSLRWSTPALLNDPFDVQFDLQFGPDPDRLLRLSLDRLWDAHCSPNPFVPRNVLGAIVAAFRGKFPRLSRDEFDAKFAPAVSEGLRRLRTAIPAAHAEIRKQLSNVKVLCLTEAPTNTLMWAHYAAGSSGLALRFRSVELLDSPWKLALPVNYVSAIPQMFSEEHLAMVSAGMAQMSPPGALRQQICTKSLEWAYE